MENNNQTYGQNEPKSFKRKWLLWTCVVVTCAIVFGLLFLKTKAGREQDKRLHVLNKTEYESKVGVGHPRRPIKKETTKIVYRHHTNSGMAIYTSVKLYPDHLVWDYNEARNDCHLKDTCRYKKEEFDELVKELSTIKFSVRDSYDRGVGGSGYSYSFEAGSQCYLEFDESYRFSGDYEKVSDLIKQFIASHKTRCEILFEELSMKPHERGEFGEFMELPHELQKYAVQ